MFIQFISTLFLFIKVPFPIYLKFQYLDKIVTPLIFKLKNNLLLAAVAAKAFNDR